jgi:hypothetical protein
MPMIYIVPTNFLSKIQDELEAQIRFNGSKSPFYVSDKYGTIYGSAGLFFTLVPI